MNPRLFFQETIFRALAARRAFYVVSHERSGTHFAINTIFRNTYVRPFLHYVGDWLGPYDNPETRYSHLEKFRNEWPRLRGRGGIIKTHSDASLFRTWYPVAPVVYVWRDPRDTMVSFFHYLNSDELHRTNPGLESQRCASFADFLRRPLSNYLKHGFSDSPDIDSVVARWASHVSGWLAMPGVIVVRYEQLKTDFRRVLYHICRSVPLLPRLQQKPVELKDAVSVLPRTGVVGEWKKYFSDADEEFLEAQAARFGLQRRDWHCP